MSLAQKFRGLITSKAPAAALAGLLAILPVAFNNTAQAQEPRITTVSNVPAAIAPDLQKRIDQANRDITKNIEEIRALADQARRAARGEIVDGKESDHTIEAQARSHSLTKNQIGFFIIEGKNSGLNGDQVEHTIMARFLKNDVKEAKPFRDPDLVGESTVIGYYVRGQLIGPFGLNKTAIKGADDAAALFKGSPLAKASTSVAVSPHLENE